MAIITAAEPLAMSVMKDITLSPGRLTSTPAIGITVGVTTTVL